MRREAPQSTGCASKSTPAEDGRSNPVDGWRRRVAADVASSAAARLRGSRTENRRDIAGGSPLGRRHPRRLSPTPRRHSVRRRRPAGKRTSASRWPPSDAPTTAGRLRPYAWGEKPSASPSSEGCAIGRRDPNPGSFSPACGKGSGKWGRICRQAKVFPIRRARCGGYRLRRISVAADIGFRVVRQGARNSRVGPCVPASVVASDRPRGC